MKRIIRNASLVVAVALTATACTRRVQVESEPNEPRYQETTLDAAAAVDVVGVYDYVAEVDNGSGDMTGPMTITRAAGYAVRFVMQDGGETLPFSATRRT